MTTTADEPVTALGDVLGAEPPASLHDLDPAVVIALTEAIQAESRRQQQALGRAVDNALRLVPRPFRGVVRRLIQQ